MCAAAAPCRRRPGSVGGRILLLLAQPLAERPDPRGERLPGSGAGHDPEPVLESYLGARVENRYDHIGAALLNRISTLLGVPAGFATWFDAQIGPTS